MVDYLKIIQELNRKAIKEEIERASVEKCKEVYFKIFGDDINNYMIDKETGMVTKIAPNY